MPLFSIGLQLLTWLPCIGLHFIIWYLQSLQNPPGLKKHKEGHSRRNYRCKFKVCFLLSGIFNLYRTRQVKKNTRKAIEGGITVLFVNSLPFLPYFSCTMRWNSYKLSKCIASRGGNILNSDIFVSSTRMYRRIQLGHIIACTLAVRLVVLLVSFF
ncbi:uncharacterized protein [Coffea arabica]|uniref:Uncharacterized protein n=1 Tax=Coffea arabica TaxID=13443 RepID=A0ABM4WQG7_COFAR